MHIGHAIAIATPRHPHPHPRPTSRASAPRRRFPLRFPLLRRHCHTHGHTSSIRRKPSLSLCIAAERRETRQGCATHCTPSLPRGSVLGGLRSQYHRPSTTGSWGRPHLWRVLGSATCIVSGDGPMSCGWRRNSASVYPVWRGRRTTTFAIAAATADSEPWSTRVAAQRRARVPGKASIQSGKCS
ncbi:hypothetical protein C8F01DRAFT_1181326 [Mycena amicta]|nr:hypothetical protein C8F01DRAFT_1181326 [Mycena amicta]